MAKIIRKNQKIFGQNALTAQIGVFGSLAAGSPTTTTDPETIQSLSNYLGGWFSGVVGSNSPAIEDMNALHYLYAYQLAYLMQSGIPEYDANTTYYIGSVVSYNNIAYQSLTDNNIGNTPSIGANWKYSTDSLYTKATAGSNTYATSTTVQGQLDQLDAGLLQIVPAGTILPFGGTVAPSKYLLCDGSSLNRTGTYANLFSVIGTAFGTSSGTTFNIPDLRGQFLRGVDYTAGRDPDKLTRTAMNIGGNTGNDVGSIQSDSFRAHVHEYFNRFNVLMNSGTGNTVADDIGANANTTSTGGSETRPINAYVNYIIKF